MQEEWLHYTGNKSSAPSVEEGADDDLSWTAETDTHCESSLLASGTHWCPHTDREQQGMSLPLILSHFILLLLLLLIHHTMVSIIIMDHTDHTGQTVEHLLLETETAALSEGSLRRRRSFHHHHPLELLPTK